YVTCDERLATRTTVTVTDAEIIGTVNQNIDDDDVNENGVDQTDPASFEPPITNKEARAVINTLRIYVERSRIVCSLFELENSIEKKSANCLNQKKITGFF
ncbi:hypothetical protein WA026_008772, partial [Henosepilachna vigintioctopunctata]